MFKKLLRYLSRRNVTTANRRSEDNLGKLQFIKDQVDELFIDESFPNLVLLDGAWGSGKTFFAQESLIPEYQKSEEVFYLSVLGVSSKNEFVNRLIATCFKKRNGNQASLIDSAESIFGRVEKNADQLGWAGSLGAGFSDVVKSYLIGGLGECKIVVDDLERLNERDLQMQIIGECYQLAEVNNISFLFLTDKKALQHHDECKGLDAFIEKAFSGTVPYIVTDEEVFNIAFPEHKEQVYALTLKESVAHYDIVNLRVLKRLSRRIFNILNAIEKLGYADIEATMRLVVEEAVAVVWLNYAHERDKEGIRSVLKISLPTAGRNENAEIKDLRSQLFGMIYPSEELIDYLIGESHYIDDITCMVRVVGQECPVDAFMFSVFKGISENDFGTGLEELKNYIFKQRNVLFQKWFEACEVYKLLIEWEYIEGNISDFVADLEAMVEDKRFEVETNRSRTYRVSDEKIRSLMERTKLALDKRNEQAWVAEFSSQLNDWLAAESLIRNDNLEPKLHLVPVDSWKDAMNEWSSLSFVEFGGFLRDRYKGQLLNSYFEPEQDLMRQLVDEVEALLDNIPYGSKRGAVVRLDKTLKSLLDGQE